MTAGDAGKMGNPSAGLQLAWVSYRLGGVAVPTLGLGLSGKYVETGRERED